MAEVPYDCRFYSLPQIDHDMNKWWWTKNVASIALFNWLHNNVHFPHVKNKPLLQSVISNEKNYFSFGSRVKKKTKLDCFWIFECLYTACSNGDIPCSDLVFFFLEPSILTEFFYRRQWPTQNESQKCINSSLIYLWQSRSVRACSSFGLTTPNTFILERLPWSCTHDHWFHQENPLLWPLISVQKAFYPIMACYHHPGYTEHSVLFVDLACSQSKLAVIAVYTYGVACIIWCKKQ